MFYCNKKCQKQDWNQCHRNECHLFSNNAIYFVNKDCDRFLLRLWLLTQFNDKSNERLTERHELYNGLNRCFDDLITHSIEIRNDRKRMECFDEICNRFKSIDLDFDYEKLFLLFCKICINSFSILNEDLNQIGSGLYICGSVLNHSCEPNSAPIFRGIQLEVRAIKTIEANEEILINYIDLKMCGTDRRTRLREQYYFDCNCVKCSTNSDINIDYSLVKRLDKEFDELIENKNDWNKCYSIGLQTIPLYKQIYGDFHPDLTVQLMRILKVKYVIIDDFSDRNVIELIEKIRDSIKISHGFEHKLFYIFKQTIGL